MEHRKAGPTSCDLLKIIVFILAGFAKEGDCILTLTTDLPKIITLPENSPSSTFVYTFKVVSTNVLSNAGPIFFNPNPASHPFKISPSSLVTPSPFAYTYQVEVASNSPVLDYETLNIYTLPIYVSDVSGISTTAILTINITNVNEPPVFLDSLGVQDLTLYVPENLSIGPLYKVLAWDPDGDAYTFTCSPNTNFDINAAGELATKKSFDFETDPKTYVLQIIVSDGRGLFSNGTVYVYIENINDNTPIFTNVALSHNVIITEELSLGTSIITLTATDSDNLGPLSFSIDQTLGYLSVDGATGQVSVSRRMDLEGACPNFLQFAITVCDIGGRWSTSALNVTVTDINDNPPVCVAPYTINIQETQLPISVLTNVVCTDIDVTPVNKAFDFTIMSTGLAATNLEISPNGIISLQRGMFDYENLTNLANGYTYQLVVVARNTASPFLSATVSLYLRILPVNEFAPQFSQISYTFTIAETKSAGAALGQVLATDQDFILNDITYRLQGPGIGRFLINPTTGTVTAIAKLDYETAQRYDLVALAVDGDPFAPRTATANVTVIVLEENDEPPICNPLLSHLTLTDAASVGTNIEGFTLPCMDADSAADEMRYDIASGNINNHFGFSPSRGSSSPRLLLMRAFDYKGQVDTVQSFRLEVHVIDDNKRNVSAQTGTAVILVTVVRTSTTAPTVKSGVVINRVSENSYAWNEWYVPFLITLAALLLATLLAFLLYRLFKSKAFRDCLRSCCKARNKPPVKQPLVQEKKKVEFVQEITKINTVFDGEAVDPLTGKTYEYNSTSGARRWKEPSAQAPAPAPAKTSAPAAATAAGAAPKGIAAPTAAAAAKPSPAPSVPPAAGATAAPPATAPPAAPAAARAAAPPPAAAARAAAPPPAAAAAAPATNTAHSNAAPAPLKSSMKAEPPKPSSPKKPDKPSI